eukprot:XP_011604186.1 PREDICTED: uncharacterized protein LOC105416729 [Takifugu rubripes]
MTSSTSYRTLVWFITIFFITQVSPQCDRPLLQRDFIIPSCCPRASDAPIREPVDACFEQLENTSDQCKIHFYVWTGIFDFFHYITTVAKNCFSLFDLCLISQFFSLITKKEAWCVDPRAWWLPNRLKMLERVSQTQSVILSIMFTWRFFKKKKNVSILSINVMPYLEDNAIFLPFNQMQLGRMCNIWLFFSSERNMLQNVDETKADFLMQTTLFHFYLFFVITCVLRFFLFAFNSN